MYWTHCLKSPSDGSLGFLPLFCLHVIKLTQIKIKSTSVFQLFPIESLRPRSGLSCRKPTLALFSQEPTPDLGQISLCVPEMPCDYCVLTNYFCSPARERLDTFPALMYEFSTVSVAQEMLNKCHLMTAKKGEV